MKEKITTILIIIAVLIGFYFLTSQKPNTLTSTLTPTSIPTPTSDLVLFYGSTCPHCKVVEEFISTNKIDQKLTISQLEVYENKSNVKIFSDMVKKVCPDQLNPEGLPVPFLIDQKNNKCLVGDTPITDYLSEKSK